MTRPKNRFTLPARARRWVASVLAAAAVVAAAGVLFSLNEAPSSTTASSDLTPPIRAAFYYPWYPEHWQETPRFDAGLGNYDSADPLVIKNHIAQMEFAHIDAGIASWWGRGSPEDTRISTLLSAAQGTEFRWALYYEPEYYSNKSQLALAADLDYIEREYSNHPSYLRVEGKPVLFVFTGNDDDCARLKRWYGANNGRFYLSFRAPYGSIPAECSHWGDSWHVYDPTQYWNRLPGYSTTISPGFWKGDEASPRLARNLQAWSWVAVVARHYNDPWQLVTTWNEWPEGTGIEPDNSHGFDYIRVLNEYWGDR